MATIRISKAELKKCIKSEEELVEKINLMGTPVESVSENEIEVQILPNRPDLLPVQGFLRAFKAYAGKEEGLKHYNIHKPEENYKVKIDSSVKAVRPFTACAIVKGIHFDNEKIKEVIDLQEKLHTTVGRNRKKLAIGIYPLEKIKLPIRFEARKPEDIKFIPLEEDKEMNGLQVLQRTQTGREYAPLLEGIDKFPVFVDANNKIMSMPPIINSNDTGKITEQTKDIFIECSGFDFEVLKKTLNIIVTALADIGGKVYAMELDYGKKEITPNLAPEKMKISIENINKLLGLELKEKDIEKLLPKMGYDYSAGKVSIPAWRTDILHEVDIAEDVAIAYGYNNLVPEIPEVATVGEESEESKFKSKIAEMLIGLGLIEISSFHLIKDDEAGRIGVEEKIELENSKTEYKFLRPSLLAPALRTFSENKDNEYPQRIFEIGTVFSRDSREKSETGINEDENVIIASSPGSFTEMKQILDYMTRMLGIGYKLEEHTKKGLIDGRTGIISLNEKRIGYIGEIHPETLQEWNIKQPVAVIELSLNEIMKMI